MRARHAVLLAAAALAGASARARGDALAERIDARLAAHPELAGAHVGLAVMDVLSGRALYRRAADDAFNVGSNVKIVTGAAALALLGPAYTWTTTFLGDAPPAPGADELRGNLYLRAGGDPTLDTAALWQMADALRQLGVKRVTGALIIDDGFFDAATIPPAFEQKPEDDAFRAPVSAASLHYNAVAVRVQPGAAAGAKPRVTVSPAQDYVTVENDATTGPSGRTAGKTDIKVTSRPAEGGVGTIVTVSGRIRLDDAAGVVERKRIEHPTPFFTAGLRRVLADAGVKIKGGARRGAIPPGAAVLVAHESAPLGTVLRDMEKWSNNFIAEDVLRTIGAEATGQPGTWAAGAAAVKAWLAQVGLPAGTYRYENGSGLYDSNRFSPWQLACVLRAAWLDFRVGPDLAGALAVAGADGTLSRRMAGTAAERYVRAKSGTLAGVRSLSGYVGGVGRPILAFSMLIDGLDSDPARRAAREVEDELAAVLAEWVDRH